MHYRIVISSLWAVALFIITSAARADLAPNFESLPRNADIAIMPPDIEFFSLTAGGVTEPKADWTKDALSFTTAGLRDMSKTFGVKVRMVPESDADELAELGALHAAVAQSISLHYAAGGRMMLPTKNGELDWSLGDAVAPLRSATGSDYALFTWVRDTYATAERKALSIGMALLRVPISNGIQMGYASLVDLRTGRIVWFNQLRRGKGDLRDESSTRESLAALLYAFPTPE